MNNRHKYFRNLRYKQKLEARYDHYDGYHTGIYFLTKEPDPRAIREDNNFYLRNPKLTSEWDKRKGHEHFMYYKRPEVPYSVIEFQWGRNGWKKIMKWQTARRNRRIKITEDDTSWRAKSFYKKYEDRWNYD